MQAHRQDARIGRAIRGDFLIHVDIARILANKEEGAHEQVTVIRSLDRIGKPIYCREVAFDGPARFVHHEFQKIEGTKVQNWVEVDVPLTMFRDNKPITVLRNRKGEPMPMMKKVFGKRVIHVAAPVLMRNRAEGRNDPVIAVRNVATDWATDVVYARKVEWNGPTLMCHRPTTPIPGTNGRGVAFIETDAPITVFTDDGVRVLE